MTASSFPLLDAHIRDALEAVYREFAAPAPPAIVGCLCPCCFTTRDLDTLVTTPLRELTAQALWGYASGFNWTVGSKRDFRYLLPRILDISVNDPRNANEPEVVLRKLGLADWQSWSASEQRAVEEFVDAWFERALAQDLAGARRGWVDSMAESVLCGAACAGFPLARWLTRLCEPSAAPVLMDLKERSPDDLSAFWGNAPTGLEELSTFLGQR